MAGWRIIGGIIDESIYGISRHLLGWIGCEQWEEAVYLAELHIQPEIVVIGRENHGHPVVKAPNEGIGGRGDDRA